MNLPDLDLQFVYARLAWGVVLGALALSLARRWDASNRVVLACLAVVAAGSQWFPGPWSPAWWLGLAFQSPSGLSAVLCAVILRDRWLGRDSAGLVPLPLAAALVAAGALLYLDASGWLALGGIYFAGFGAVAAPVAALLMAGACAWAIARGAGSRAAGAVLAAVSLFTVLRLPTGNLWDALLDPFLWLWCVGACLSALRGRIALRPRPAGAAG